MEDVRTGKCPSQEIVAKERDTTVSKPLIGKFEFNFQLIRGTSHAFSYRKKSLVSDRSISLTPGSRMMDLIGRLFRESVPHHDPWESAKETEVRRSPGEAGSTLISECARFTMHSISQSSE